MPQAFFSSATVALTWVPGSVAVTLSSISSKDVLRGAGRVGVDRPVAPAAVVAPAGRATATNGPPTISAAAAATM
ncbi:hypothetical protein SGLAM104S_06728 [Streptomyces glaucescens]